MTQQEVNGLLERPKPNIEVLDRLDAAQTRIAELEAANKECVDTAKKLIFDSVKLMKDCANLEDLANSERAAYMTAIDDALIIIDSTDVSQAAIAKASGGANT